MSSSDMNSFSKQCVTLLEDFCEPKSVFTSVPYGLMESEKERERENRLKIKNKKISDFSHLITSLVGNKPIYIIPATNFGMVVITLYI